MKLLTLDLATKTGFAVGDISSGERPLSGTHTLPSTGTDIGRFLLAFDRWVSDLIVFHKPSLVVFEAPLFLAGGKSNISTARKLMCLAGMTEYFCSKHKVMVRECNVSTIKKYFTGNGRADKPKMIAAAKALGFEPKDDNEADALAIYFYTMNKLHPTQAQKWDARSTTRLL